MEKNNEENKGYKKPYIEQRNNNAFKMFSREVFLSHGTQFGHQKRSWNPAMKPFIQGSKNRIHIINVTKTSKALSFSFNQVKKIAEKGGTFLFVGTNDYSKKTIKLNAERTESFYVNHRWLGGTLTNFKTIQNSVKKLRTLERLEKDNFKGYTKKEGIEMKRELEKLEMNLNGIKFMRKLPNALIVSNIIDGKIAIKEAKKLGITVFAISDTNTDPRFVDYPIPSNDDGSKSVSLIITALADAIATAKGNPTIAAFKPEEEMQILGIIERKRVESSTLLRRSQRSTVDRTLSQKIEKVERTESQKERSEINQEIEQNSLNKKSVADLKKMLSNANIKGISALKKDDLIKEAEKNNLS